TFRESIYSTLPEEIAERLISDVKIANVNTVLTWLHNKGREYLDEVNKLDIDALLRTKVSCKVVLLDELLSEEEENNREINVQLLGYEIADGNN
ncbi:hypothetical protein, partial [Acinetobacter baumannii]|uniref:hypothetical protein n=1 Tax=Acinetobacter baumannii TaxID=470 RepID=UPI000ADCA6CF